LDLFVDDKKVDDDRVVGGTLAETLRDVQAHCCPPPRILVGFRCDGAEVAGAAMASTLSRPAGSFELLEVFTSTREDLVADAMNQASASLEETEGVTQNVAELLMEGKASEGIERLGECIRMWQQIHDAVVKSLGLLRLDAEQLTVRDEPLLTALDRSKDVLLQIKGALQAQDHVLLADILQYEFSDVSDLWHTMIARIRQEADDLRAASGGAT
jgi:hypothetical protein